MIYFFFFNDTATTEIYTLSLHDALPIFGRVLRDEAHLKAPRDEHEAAARQRLPVVLALEDVALRDRQGLLLEERQAARRRVRVQRHVAPEAEAAEGAQARRLGRRGGGRGPTPRGGGGSPR